MDLFNRGEAPVQDFTLIIQTDTQYLQNEILGSLVVDVSENEIHDAAIVLCGKNIELTVKFLNPFKQYRDRLTLYIFSSASIEIKDAKGRGLGWGAAYFDQLEYERDLEDGFAKAVSGSWYGLAYGLGQSIAVVVKRLVR